MPDRMRQNPPIIVNLVGIISPSREHLLQSAQHGCHYRLNTVKYPAMSDVIILNGVASIFLSSYHHICLLALR